MKILGPNRFFAPLALWLAILGSVGCSKEPTPGLEALSDAEFERLSLDLGEAPGYFDTDNLISNETSYQHVIPKLVEIAGKGGGYIGVGPDQNFTYVSNLEPQVAFLIDIRRDNLLELLYFKQLFEIAETPAQYLSSLLGRPWSAPDTSAELDAEAFSDVVTEMRQATRDPAYFRATFEATWRALRRRFPLLVQEDDRATLQRMADSFFEQGLELKFTSYGRPPRAMYPSLERLLNESDLAGNHHNFLSSPRLYQVVRHLQSENRIIPVVGDLAGGKALRGIGEYLRRHRLKVSAFYTSNVEFYLFADQTFGRFVDNVRTLPIGERSLFIRSYFSYWRDPHPESVPGYYVTSLLQPIGLFLENDSRSPFRNYTEVILKDYVPIASEGAAVR